MGEYGGIDLEVVERGQRDWCLGHAGHAHVRGVDEPIGLTIPRSILGRADRIIQ